MLHITNGDGAAELIRQAGVVGTIVPWRDALHEGPVPAENPATLREIRARFLVGEGWSELGDVLPWLEWRDHELERVGDHDEVVLWFEHDLYDQLQLLQILDRLAGAGRNETRLSLICIGSHPGIDRFLGLAQLAPPQIAALFEPRRPITRDQLEAGRGAWAAFTADDPTAIVEVLVRDGGSLEFLKPALARHLEQYPSVRNGMCRTENAIVDLLEPGPTAAGDLFRRAGELEEAPFMGDAPFWSYLDRLASAPRPLLRFVGATDTANFEDRSIVLTDDGASVGRGEADFVRLNGIDRWLGGVHLYGERSTWRWDETGAKLVNDLAP